MNYAVNDEMREKYPDITPEIRRALIKVTIDPTVWPTEDGDLRALLVNSQWAQPCCWIDIFDNNKLRYEWRLCHKGESYLHHFPASIDEISSLK